MRVLTIVDFVSFSCSPSCTNRNEALIGSVALANL